MRRIGVAALVAVLVGGGCGDEERRAPRGPVELAQLRRFDGFPLYWLGRSFDGLPLTYAEDVKSQLAAPSSPGVAIEYGDCTLPEGEGGCVAPLSITIHCAERVERYDTKTRRVRIRGVPGRVVGPDGLELYTGPVIVSIGGDGGRARAVAEALRPLNARASARRRLPPPTFDTTPRDEPEPSDPTAPVPAPPARC